MVGSGKAVWRPLEARRATVFLVAGMVFSGYAGLKTVRLLTGIPVPDVVSVTVGHIALFIPVIGLLGLYRQVRAAAPRLARAGAVTSVISGVCSIVLLLLLTHLTLTMAGYPSIPEDARGPWGVIVLLLSLVTILLGFLFFGVGSRRTETVGRPIGSLLLVPAVMWVSLFGMHAAGVNGTVIGVVVYVPIAAALVTIGYRLRHTPTPTDRERHRPTPV